MKTVYFVPYYPFCDFINNASSPKRRVKRMCMSFSSCNRSHITINAQSQWLSFGSKGQPALLESSPGLCVLLENVVSNSVITQKINIALDPRQIPPASLHVFLKV